MKIILLLTIVFAQLSIFSQTKKEEIILLEQKIDSIYNKINQTRSDFEIRFLQQKTNEKRIDSLLNETLIINSKKELEIFQLTNSLSTQKLNYSKIFSQVTKEKSEYFEKAKKLRLTLENNKELDRTLSSYLEFQSRTVKIGSQIWMKENLEVETFRNGDSIPYASTVEEWVLAANNKQPAYCYYNFNSFYGQIYGKLYNSYALTDSRGIAPLGFHVSTIQDWNTLISFFGGIESINVPLQLKSSNFWENYMTNGSMRCDKCATWSYEYRSKKACEYCKDNRVIKVPIESKSGNGLNKSGFTALPGGYIDGLWGQYNHKGIGKCSYWWTEYSPTCVYISERADTPVRFESGPEESRVAGFYIRCLKD